MAGCLDGRPSDVQRASQQMSEEDQGSRCSTAHTHEDARNHSRVSMSCPDSLVSSRRVKGSEVWWDPRVIG